MMVSRAAFSTVLVLIAFAATAAQAQIVAYVDSNANGTYESGTDPMIFQVVDSDDNGAVTVGDTVRFGYFPDSMTGTTTNGPTANTPLTVQTATNCDPASQCEITFAGIAYEIRFGKDSTREYCSFIDDGTFIGALLDNDTYDQDDRLWMEPSASGQPFFDLADIAFAELDQPGDQSFFNLIFNLPLPVELTELSVE